MSIIIEQQPRYQLLPVGQPVVFAVSENTTIVNKYNVKFLCKIYVHWKTSGLTNSAQQVAVVKATPNNKGRGIFDISSILENYVSPDYKGGMVNPDNSSDGSEYKEVQYSDTTPHPIHLIDKFSTGRNIIKYFRVRFNIEYSDDPDGALQLYASAYQTHPNIYLFFNGVLQNNQKLDIDSSSGDIGYNLNRHYRIPNATTSKLLSNAPTTQYLRSTDYMTIGYIASYNEEWTVAPSGSHPSVRKVEIRGYNSSDSLLFTSEIQDSTANGGSYSYATKSMYKLHYFGVGAGNFLNRGSSFSNWNTHKDNVSYYKIRLKDSADNIISQTYTFNIHTDDCKGFETIRLTWLNRLGTWDYYNFTKKSVRSLKTKKTRYTQMRGVWNQERYQEHGYLGGEKVYSQDTKETIKVNTAFLTDEEAIWLEELFTSPDVYILQGYETSDLGGYINKYVEPCIVSSNTYVRKTKANDKLVQYTLNIERSNNINIQKA